MLWFRTELSPTVNLGGKDAIEPGFNYISGRPSIPNRLVPSITYIRTQWLWVWFDNDSPLLPDVLPNQQLLKEPFRALLPYIQAMVLWL